MTYCVGWKYKNSVYLLADTAVTKPNEPVTPKTSFGQIHDKVRGQYVEEALLKLVPIAPGIAVAFAGDVQLAGEIIEFLQGKLPFAKNFEQLFDFLDTELGPFPRTQHVQLLIAATSKDGNSNLLCWDSALGLAKQNFDFCQIGSLAFTSHADNTTRALSILAKGNIATDCFLPAISAIVQSYGVHNNIITENAGGIFFGLCSQNEMISWQDDTNYILYTPSFEVNCISAFVRENVLVVQSTYIDAPKIFSHSVSTLSLEKWLARWEKEARAQLKSEHYKYWVFISTAERIITLILREKLEIQSKYFTLKYGGEHFDLELKPELQVKLLQSLADRGDGTRPFTFKFISD